MTCSSYSIEQAVAAEEALTSLEAEARAEIDIHLETLRQAPLPAPDNSSKGPFWSKTENFLVFHAVHARDCRIVLLWIFPQSSVAIG